MEDGELVWGILAIYVTAGGWVAVVLTGLVLANFVERAARFAVALVRGRGA